MFSGIIQQVGVVSSVSRNADGSGRLAIKSSSWAEPVVLGESIANNGICLTVTDIKHDLLGFDVLDETFKRTNLGDLQPGNLVNLERALRVGETIGGHFVTGHVDGTGVTTALDMHGRDIIWRIRCEKHLTDGMVPKGSIACDGISLTIVDLQDGEFSVHLIPHTLSHTNVKGALPGQRVNLETDMLGKYVSRLIRAGYAR